MDIAEARKRIIVAVDVPEIGDAMDLVDTLADSVGYFKFGLELLSRYGLESVICDCLCEPSQIFVDLKLCDIPNTVGATAKQISEYGVGMFNVHASSGMGAMEAAVANRGGSLVLAVTILTSLRAKDLFQLGYPSAWPAVEGIEHYHGYDLDGNAYLRPLVARMARCAKTAGCDGIICSPQELSFLNKQSELQGLIKVTPGVRPSWAATNDQKRVMTPGEAIRAGADYLVIGRPITKPPESVGSMVNAADMIAEEIAAALEEVKV